MPETTPARAACVKLTRGPTDPPPPALRLIALKRKIGQRLTVGDQLDALHPDQCEIERFEMLEKAAVIGGDFRRHRIADLVGHRQI